MLVIAVSAQSAERGAIPSPAVRDFASRYPSITPKKWQENKVRQFIARFKLDRNPSEAFYDEVGSWLKTETHYKSPSKLPAAIRKALHNSEYASCRFDYMQETDSAGQKRFYVTAGYLDTHSEGPGNSAVYRLTISPEGQIVQTKRID